MFGVVLVGMVLVAADPAPGKDVHAHYDTARATVGRDPDAHVALALWCEAQGLEAERLKHLAQAILIDPKHGLARSLMGLVQQGEKWASPDRAKADEILANRLAEYNARREKLDGSAASHWTLAVWCQENGLEPEAKAHLTVVTRLKPESTEAWKRLGYVKHGGRWVDPEEAARDDQRQKEQREATARWQPKLETLRAQLTNPKERVAAEAELAAITDPLAIPAVWRVLGNSRPEHQRLAVQILGQIDSPAAATPLIVLLTASRDPEVRRAAGETLTSRDVRESLDGLIALVRTPTVYRVIAGDRPGTLKTLEIESQTARVERHYAAPPPPTLTVQEWLVRNAGTRVVQSGMMGLAQLELASSTFDPGIAGALGQLASGAIDPAALREAIASGARGPSPDAGPERSAAAWNAENLRRTIAQTQERNTRDYQRAVARTEARFQRDIALIEQGNAVARQLNDRVLPTLERMTGERLGDDNAGWTRWWAQEQGYSYEPPPKPTYQQQTPAAVPSYAIPVRIRQDCFAAGTPVLTLDGSRPIETLRVGDRILAQDPTSGLLAYQPVVALVFTPRHATLRVRLDGTDEPLVVTPIHRFWRPGEGWTMARDLKPGDTLRLVGATARVAAVEPGEIIPVYNIEVAGAHSFFAGPQRVLVHDVTLPEPVSSPFDARGTLVRASD